MTSAPRDEPDGTRMSDATQYIVDVRNLHFGYPGRPILKGLSLKIPRGKLVAIAVSSAKRTPLFPEVPPISDAFPGFEAQGWTGVLAPAATPRPVIDYLNAALRKVLAQAEVRERLENQGYEVVASTPEAFGEWVRNESSKWARIIREQKITLD